MSLTSYRAAPPRVKISENGRHGIFPRAAYVAIVTALEKAGSGDIVPLSPRNDVIIIVQWTTGPPWRRT
jgi:hypothetical protein